MKYVWATGTHVGRVREGNEDTVFPTKGGAGAGPLLIGVADGMGGHAGGEVASQVAMETVVAEDGPLSTRVEAANRAVLDRVDEDPALAGMGTTMSIIEFSEDGTMKVAHVGDSRIYRRRDGELVQLTTDHTFIEELLASGKISPDEAERHPKRHFLTRVVGTPWDFSVDSFEDKVEAGDRIMACSDGLSGFLDDDEINDHLERAESPEQAVWDLIESANRAGGLDNITVAVIDATE